MLRYSPARAIGIEAANPAIGPAAPMSKRAFLSGNGSRMLMNAPNVPNRNGGGTGMKYGSDA